MRRKGVPAPPKPSLALTEVFDLLLISLHEGFVFLLFLFLRFLLLLRLDVEDTLGSRRT